MKIERIFLGFENLNLEQPLPAITLILRKGIIEFVMSLITSFIISVWPTDQRVILGLWFGLFIMRMYLIDIYCDIVPTRNMMLKKNINKYSYRKRRIHFVTNKKKAFFVKLLCDISCRCINTLFSYE